MVWLILLLISLVFVFFIWSSHRDERSDREAVVPRRPARPALDMETADEPGGHPDTEFSEELQRKLSMDLDENTEVDFDAMVDEIHRNMVKKPLHRDKAGPHHPLVEPEWAVVGVIDAVGDAGPGKDRHTARDLLTDREAKMEYALETGRVAAPPERITVFDSSLPPNHVLRIGAEPERVSGFDLPIHLELSPAMVALAKDPYWAFVYWVLPAEVPVGEWELRVHNLSRQQDFFQKVDPGARRWYLHLNEPECLFRFELGVRDEHGHFHAVLASNEILLPPDRPSDVIDSDWLTVDEFYKYRGQLDSKGSPDFIMEFGGASEQVVRSVKQS